MIFKCVEKRKISLLKLIHFCFRHFSTVEQFSPINHNCSCIASEVSNWNDQLYRVRSDRKSPPRPGRRSTYRAASGGVDMRICAPPWRASPLKCASHFLNPASLDPCGKKNRQFFLNHAFLLLSTVEWWRSGGDRRRANSMSWKKKPLEAL